jgi:hypothetical protein
MQVQRFGESSDMQSTSAGGASGTAGITPLETVGTDEPSYGGGARGPVDTGTGSAVAPVDTVASSGGAAPAGSPLAVTGTGLSDTTTTGTTGAPGARGLGVTGDSSQLSPVPTGSTSGYQAREANPPGADLDAPSGALGAEPSGSSLGDAASSTGGDKPRKSRGFKGMVKYFTGGTKKSRKSAGGALAAASYRVLVNRACNL